MKKRSATSSPRLERVYFADENLGRFKFPGLLRDAGVEVRAHLDVFAQGAADTEWLPQVGARGWVLLTLDTRLRYNRLEQAAIMEHGVAAFVIVGGRSHDEKGRTFLEARTRVELLLDRQQPPFIA